MMSSDSSSSMKVPGMAGTSPSLPIPFNDTSESPNGNAVTLKKYANAVAKGFAGTFDEFKVQLGAPRKLGGTPRLFTFDLSVLNASVAPKARSEPFRWKRLSHRISISTSVPRHEALAVRLSDRLSSRGNHLGLPTYISPVIWKEPGSAPISILKLGRCAFGDETVKTSASSEVSARWR